MLLHGDKIEKYLFKTHEQIFRKIQNQQTNFLFLFHLSDFLIENLCKTAEKREKENSVDV
jgi:hypothetical protein